MFLEHLNCLKLFKILEYITDNLNIRYSIRYLKNVIYLFAKLSKIPSLTELKLRLTLFFISPAQPQLVVAFKWVGYQRGQMVYP